MNTTVRHRSHGSRPAGGCAASRAVPFARLRHMSARALLFSLLTFVLVFGAPIMRSVGIFEEDRTDGHHRVGLAPMPTAGVTEQRQMLPEFVPWDRRSRLPWRPWRAGTVATVPARFDWPGPPPCRASPGRSA